MKKIVIIAFVFLTSFIYGQTQRLEYVINSNNNFKISYTYDVNNIHIKSNEYEYSNGNWVMLSEKLFSYDANNRINEITEMNVNNGSLVNSIKKEFSYNTNTQTEVDYNWNGTNWVQTEEYQMTFNSDDLIIERILTENTKITFQYNANNELMNREYYYWNTTSGQWNNYSERKYVFSYDSNDNRINTIKSNYYNGTWTDDTKIEYNYDNSFTESNLILPYYERLDNFDLSFNHKVNSLMFYENNNGTWSSTNSWTLHYSDVSLGVGNINSKNYTVYPNPTTNQVKFDITDFEKIEIYDITGKLITKTETNIVNMENVPNGTYLYRIQKGNKIINGKIIKK